MAVIALGIALIAASGGEEGTATTTEVGPTFSEFQAQVERTPDSVERVVFHPTTETLEVTETDGDEYTTGYLLATEDDLLKALEREGIEAEVASD